jgi:tripartite-type tricarboxylate transporter receptor subunit TctC
MQKPFGEKESMKIPRRKFLHLASGGGALAAVPRLAWAQSYPARPVHLIVGFAAGTSPDIFTRLIAQLLSQRLGQPCVVENRVGAGSNIATEVVARSSPDGYTLLLVSVTNAINASLYDKLNFNFIRDIRPIASTVRGLGVMEVNPSFPASTVPEFIAYAKANPGKINMGSAGNGTPQHLYGELFEMMAGVNLVHVPYRGSPQALSGLFAGEVSVLFDTLSTSLGHIKAGQLRALGVTSAERSQLLPDVPTIGEFLPGYDATSWQGIGAPKNTPPEVIDKLHGEINAALADPAFKARVANLGYAVFPTSQTEFGNFIVADTEKWGKVIKTANIKLD